MEIKYHFKIEKDICIKPTRTFWSARHPKAHFPGCSLFCFTHNSSESTRTKFYEDFYERTVLFGRDACCAQWRLGSVHKGLARVLLPPKCSSSSVVSARTKGLPGNSAPSLRWWAASSWDDGNPVDARRGRGVRSVSSADRSVRPSRCIKPHWPGGAHDVWLALKAPQGKREQRIKMREMRKQRGRAQTEKLSSKDEKSWQKKIGCNRQLSENCVI